MRRLLSIEFQKIWKNKASRILVLAYFFLLSSIALISSIKFTLFGNEIRIADQGIFNFPYIWHFNTFIAALFKIFLAVVIVSMMANEYTYGTLKQNLIDGLNKKEFIVSKFLVVGTFALASTFFVFVLSLILGYSFSSYTELAIVFSDLEYLLAFFIKLFAFDYQQINESERIIAFISLGCILLMISFMYQKIRRFWRERGEENL